MRMPINCHDYVIIIRKLSCQDWKASLRWSLHSCVGAGVCVLGSKAMVTWWSFLLN